MADLPHLLIFQAGNYAQAYRSRDAGDAETYREQYASVGFVAELTDRYRVTMLAMCPDPHDETLAPGLRSIGMGRPEFTRRRTRAIFQSLAPDMLIARAPHPHVLAEARARSLPTLPCFADIFSGSGVRRRLRNLYLRQMLQGPHVPCVANHSLNASRSTVTDLGLAAERVVPWDWKPLPISGHCRDAPADPKSPQLLYVGALSDAKGVGDALRALPVLHAKGIQARLTLIGGGALPPWQTQASQLGIAQHVQFLGKIPNAEVQTHMMQSDAILVPSRHSYPEGLPNVIYEGLAACTPLVISDHPAFAGRLTPQRDVLTFRASDPQALAGAVAQLCDDTALFANLSAHSESALSGLAVGLEWDRLVTLFLDDPKNQTGWVARNALLALGY